MPRQNEKRLQGQKQINQQELYDPSVPNRRIQSATQTSGGGSIAASAFSSSLGGFLSDMNRAAYGAGKIFREAAGEAEERGAAAAARGEERPDEKKAAWLRGYDRHTGAAAVHGYRNEMYQLELQAHKMELDEYEQAKEDINRKYLNGQNDDYVDGFLPRALEIEATNERTFQRILYDRQVNDETAKFKARAVVDVEAILKSDEADKPAAIRNLITDYQNEAKSRDFLDRNQVSEAIIDTIGYEASQAGNPSLLRFASVKDKDGVALVDRPEFEDKILKFHDLAVRQAEHNERKRLQEIEREKQAVENGILIEMTKAAVSGDWATVDATIQANVHRVDHKKLLSFKNLSHKLQLEDGYAKVTNIDSVRPFMIKAVNGEPMSAEDWTALADVADRPTYLAVTKAHVSAIQRMTDNPEDQVGTYFRQSLRQRLAQNNPVTAAGEFLDAKNGAVRANHIQDEMYNWWIYSDEKKSVESISKKLLQVVKEAQELAPFEGIVQPADTTGPQASTPTRAGSRIAQVAKQGQDAAAADAEAQAAKKQNLEDKINNRMQRH